MNYQNDDLRIKEIKELLPPVALLEKFPHWHPMVSRTDC